MVTLVDPRGYVVYTYGVSDKEINASPTKDTLFGIGSITKVFTGVLLADAERQGVVNLTIPISQYLPDIYIPSRNGREITLQNLATHTSGLPGDPEIYQKESDDAMKAQDAEAYERSFLEYSLTNASDIYQFVSNFSLTRDPGTQWEYSNMGTSIAGDILARTQQSNYQNLLQGAILLPLGMNNTTIQPSELPDGLITTGYRGYFSGNITEGFLLKFSDFWAPMGGIFSSGEDMAIFLAANLDLINSPLQNAIHDALIPRAIRMKEPFLLEQSLFWDTFLTSDGNRIYMKSGESNAFQSQIMMSTSDKFGVVVLANTAYIVGDPHVEIIAYELMRRMRQMQNNN